MKVKEMTLSDLRDNYLAWVSGVRDIPMVAEIHLIYPMLRYIGLDDKGEEVYACVHFNRATHLCDIYEIRPQMCKDYPALLACPQPSCNP